MSSKLLVVGCLVVLGVATAGRAELALSNAGFESPDIVGGAAVGAKPEGWFYFSSNKEELAGVSDTRKKSGSQALRFKAQKEANAFQGCAQEFACQGGAHYVFLVNAMIDPEDPMTAKGYGQISMEFKDMDGKEVGRIHGPVWGVDQKPGAWEKYMIEGDAPQGAAMGVVVVSFFAQDSNGMGTFFVDNCELIEGNAPAPAAE